jgi:Tfp pilus assembly protein PilP
VGAPPSGYDDGNRRDPFVTLIATKRQAANAPAPLVKKGSGLASVSVNDVLVRGILRSGANIMATLEGPDGKQFVAHRQDKLQDAVIKSIDKDGVVFVAQSVDVIGEAHPREVRKGLHPMEGSR